MQNNCQKEAMYSSNIFIFSFISKLKKYIKNLKKRETSKLKNENTNIPPNFSNLDCNTKTEYLKKLIKDENDSLDLSTNFVEINSPYNRPYIELLYPDISNNQLVTYVSLNEDNYAYSILGNDLEYDKTLVLPESQRCFVYNKSIIVPPEFNIDNTLFPKKKYLKIKDSELYQVMSIGVAVPIVFPPTKHYETTLVNRSSIYVYNSGTTVYLLVDSLNKKIYIMQSYCFKENENANPISLYLLKNKLKNMPKGFSYVILTVSCKSCLIAVSTIKTYPALVLRDELENSYQYLYPEFNSDIYSQLDIN